MRDQVISAAVREDEVALVDAAAKASGLTRSAYLRRAAARAAERDLRQAMDSARRGGGEGDHE